MNGHRKKVGLTPESHEREVGLNKAVRSALTPFVLGVKYEHYNAYTVKMVLLEIPVFVIKRTP